MYKLNYYDIRGSTHQRIVSWLPERSQKVVLDGQASDPVPILSDVLQSSVLGPVLFVIFYNDLPENISSSDNLSADDCVLISPSHTFAILTPVELRFNSIQLVGKIGVNRDEKEENPTSIRCLTMLLRCLQDSSTASLRLMPAALRFTPMELRMLKNAHDAATIRYDATTV